ncbi:MAG: hypothetical protein V2A71_08600, partial [Candidatus Eisenbacteria bacterium]
MFYTESERLAERHPDLAVVLERLDSQFQKMRTAEVIRPDDLASFMGIDPNQMRSALNLFAQEGVLRREEMVECRYCQMPVLRQDYVAEMEEEGEYSCTSCDRPLTEKAIKNTVTYRSGEKWKAGHPPQEVEQEATPLQPKPLTEDAYYTQEDLAMKFGVGKEALRKRLARYRFSNMGEGWKEKTDRCPRESKYLYKLSFVRHIIEELQASSQRPAK